MEQPVSLGMLDSQQELRPEHIVWIDSLDGWDYLEADEDCVAVIDLERVSLKEIRFGRNKPRCTVVGFGSEEAIVAAQAVVEYFDISFLVRPEDITDEVAPTFIFNQLACVYQPFRRLDGHFMAGDAEGEQADDPKRVVSEIDPAYGRPPLAFSETEHHQLLALANRPSTEVRVEDE